MSTDKKKEIEDQLRRINALTKRLPWITVIVFILAMIVILFEALFF